MLNRFKAPMVPPSSALVPYQPAPMPAVRRRRRLPPALPFITDLQTPLLQLSPNRRDVFRLTEACTGVHIFGATGSAKTTGSGQHLGLAYSQAGFGGIVLCAKANPSEWEVWSNYAERTGRSAQLIRFDEHGPHRFNFLEYFALTNRDAEGRLITPNVVDFLMKMKEAASRGDELQGRAPEQPFWNLAPRELLSHSIDALWTAWGRLRIDELVRFIQSAPRSSKDFGSVEAREKSFCLTTLYKAAHHPVEPIADQDLYVVLQFFKENFATLDPETRSNIVTTVTSQFTPFLKGVMREKFSTETTIVPELCFEGAIIILDFAIDRYREVGMMIQHIVKYLFQLAALKRDTRKPVRPLMIWGDESQYFVTPFDAQFQTVARSKRVSTVYLTQTVSNYMAMMGGSTPRESTMALLANFVTKIAHRNDDQATNEMMAEMIGRNLQLRGSSSRGFNVGESHSRGENFGTNEGFSSSNSQGVDTSGHNYGSSSGLNTGFSFNSGWSSNETVSEQMDFELQPREFGYLRSGGHENGLLVDAIWFQAGRRFAANRGRNFLPLTFHQGVK